ncbi:MAG: hypothetical protein K2I47_09570, partial [Odoribacter sp.]|nr:hypothetical protein [Odoribacter sp.]
PTPTPFIPETDEYYSTIEEPYVEIKEGTPGNETFEAMAGVPTTEMLYIGFGATEFLMNLELEHAKSESNEDRLYTLTYTTTKCTEVDAPCTYSCPGHTVTAPGGHMTCTSHGGKYHTHSYCSEGTASGVCSGGQITLTATCSCGQTTVTETFTPTYGSGYTECIGEDGSTDYTGMGCVHTESINTTHPHTHVWTGTVKQPIADFDYIDITNLQMWRLSKLSLESEEGLFTTPNVDFDPLTGYQLFYDQNHYKNNSGRLVFSFNWKEGERFGNATTEKTDSTLMLKEECDQAATDWFNETICSGQETKMTVVSDYINMETTEGYQIPCYHQYDSDTVIITNETFTVGGETKEIGGNEIVFSEENPIPDWGGEEEGGSGENEFWGTNPYAFIYGQNGEGWSGNELVRSGYNGQYYNTSSKWKNGSHPASLTSINPADWLKADHPNADWQVGSRDFRKDGFGNTRLTYLNLDIVDSTNPVTKAWSDQDEVEPVYNGIWDTGKCYITYEKIAEFEGTSESRGERDTSQMVDFGYDFEDTNDLDDSADYVREVGYRAGQQEVNDIVIYDPVSTQYAVVLSNDSKYDMRTEASIAEGGDPVRDLGAGCPYDETCSYAVLTCDDHGSLHTPDCYIDIVAGVNHVGGMNAHVHTKACYATHVHTDECYAGTQVRCNYCGGSGQMPGYWHHAYQNSSICIYCGYDASNGDNYSNGCQFSPPYPCSSCSGTGWRGDRTLICGKDSGGTLTLPMEYGGYAIVYEYGNTTMEIEIDSAHSYRLYQHQQGCSYAGYIHLYDVTAG